MTNAQIFKYHQDILAKKKFTEIMSEQNSLVVAR